MGGAPGGAPARVNGRTVLVEGFRFPAWFDQSRLPVTNVNTVTVDLDALDPAIMPAVGTPEPGGLTYYQALAIIETLAQRATTEQWIRVADFLREMEIGLKGNLNKQLLTDSLALVTSNLPDERARN